MTVTLTVYGHVMPRDQKRAADRFAAVITGVTITIGPEVSRGYQSDCLILISGL